MDKLSDPKVPEPGAEVPGARIPNTGIRVPISGVVAWLPLQGLSNLISRPLYHLYSSCYEPVTEVSKCQNILVLC